ncbi:MAG: CopG family antitoxin [Pseudomonadota bacterium]
MANDRKLKKMPILRTDEEAEHFVDTADLSEYDLSGFRPMSEFFEFEKKDARLEVRVAGSQLDALKAAAKAKGIPHTRLARKFIEDGLIRMSEEAATKPNEAAE